MSSNPKIEQIKQGLEEIAQQMTDLHDQLTAVTGERDAALEGLVPIMAERDRLLAERSATIADLIATRDGLQDQINQLDARIIALGG